jgi:hypothetical protein
MKKPTILLFFSILVLMVLSCSFSPGSAITDVNLTDTKVNADRVYITPVSIGSTQLNEDGSSKDGQFKMDIGDITLAGISSNIIGQSNNTIVYESTISFHVPVSFYTLIKWEQVATRNPVSVDWLEYWTYTQDFWGTPTWNPYFTLGDGISTHDRRDFPAPPHHSNYAGSNMGVQSGGKKLSVTYDTMVFNRNYETNPIADFKDLKVKIGLRTNNFTLANSDVQLKYKMYDWQLLQMRAIGTNAFSVLENYKDYFSDTSGLTVGLTFNNLDLTSGSGGALQVPLTTAELQLQAAQTLASRSVGIDFQSKLNDAGNNKYVHQQGIASPISYGNLLNAGSLTPVNTARELTIPMNIRPTLYYYEENVVVRKGIMDVRTKSDAAFDTGAKIPYCESEQSVRQRNAGIRVENIVMRQELEMQYKLYSTVQLSGDVQTDALLKMPELYRPDMIWDMMFTGDTSKAISLASNYNLFDLINDVAGVGFMVQQIINMILPIIIAIAAIYVFVQIGIPLINAKGSQLRTKK